MVRMTGAVALCTHYDVIRVSWVAVCAIPILRILDPKAASDIKDPSDASQPLGKVTTELMKHVSRRIGATAEPSKWRSLWNAMPIVMERLALRAPGHPNPRNEKALNNQGFDVQNVAEA